MLKDGIFNLTGALIRLIVISVTVPVLLHLIGVQEFGLWTLVNATISIATLAEAGLSISTTVFLSKDFAAKNNDGLSETLTITVGLMLLIASLAAVVLNYSASAIVALFSKLTVAEQDLAVTAIQIGSIVVWARLMQGVLVGPVQALRRYDIFNVINTLQAIAVNAVLVLVAWKGGLTVEMTVGVALVSILFFFAYVILNCFLLHEHRVKVRFNLVKFKLIGKYSFFTWSSALGGQFFSQGDRLIVGLLLGTTVLGIYGAITSITVQITALTAMAISPLLPRLSAIWNQGTSSNEENDMQAQLEQATAFNAFVTLGAGSLLFVLAPLIVSFVIPEATTTVAIIAFQVGILIYAIYPLNAVGYYVLFAIGAVRTNLIINLVSGSIALLLISIGAHTAGLLGAILGNVGYVVSLAFVYFGMRYTQIPFSHWVRWITAPLVWFVFVVTSNLLIGERFELRLLLYSAQVVLFVGWFGYYQRQTLLPAINRLRLSNYRWRQQH